MSAKIVDITEIIVVNVLSIVTMTFTKLSLDQITFETIISAVVAVSVIIYNISRAIHYLKKKGK